MKKEKTVEQLDKEIRTMEVFGAAFVAVMSVIGYKMYGAKGVIGVLASAAIGVGTGSTASKFKHKTKIN